MTFSAGEREQTFTILVTPDTLDEGAETVRLALGDLPPGVTAGTNATATVNIADGDVADIRFSADRGEVSEGGEVRLTFAIANDVTFQRTEAINLAIAGTATPGVDFTVVDEGGQALSAPYAIAFPPGVSSVTATVHVTDDADAEPDEDISIGASFARRGEPLGTSEIVVVASDALSCLRGGIRFGFIFFSLVVYEGGGSVEELVACAESRGHRGPLRPAQWRVRALHPRGARLHEPRVQGAVRRRAPCNTDNWGCTSLVPSGGRGVAAHHEVVEPPTCRAGGSRGPAPLAEPRERPPAGPSASGMAGSCPTGWHSPFPDRGFSPHTTEWRFSVFQRHCENEVFGGYDGVVMATNLAIYVYVGKSEKL